MTSKKIQFVSPYLYTEQLPRPKKYDCTHNIDDLIDKIDEGSQKIFSFKIPKESIYIKFYDLEEFIALNLKNEHNKILGYDTNNINNFSENLEIAIQRRGSCSTIFREGGLASLLTVIKPQSNNLEEYYFLIHSFIHEIGHATQDQYYQRKRSEAKKQIEFAKKHNYANDVLEQMKELSDDAKDIILRTDSLDKIMMKTNDLQKLVHSLESLSNQIKKEKNEFSILLSEMNVKFNDQNFYMRKEFFDDLQYGEYTLSDIERHKKRQKKAIEEIERMKKEQKELEKKSLFSEKVKEFSNAIEELKIVHTIFDKENSLKNKMAKEGWAQYFSFKIMYYLLNETNFFDKEKPEVVSAGENFWYKTKSETCVYGVSARLFQDAEKNGMTPHEIAQNVGISYGKSSKINPFVSSLKKKMKHWLK